MQWMKTWTTNMTIILFIIDRCKCLHVLSIARCTTSLSTCNSDSINIGLVCSSCELCWTKTVSVSKLIADRLLCTHCLSGEIVLEQPAWCYKFTSLQTFSPYFLRRPCSSDGHRVLLFLMSLLAILIQRPD